MKTLLLTTLTLVSGVAVAELPKVPYGAWQQDRAVAYEAPQDDTVTCMALYCTEPQLEPVESDAPYPGKTDYEIPTKEIADILKNLDSFQSKDDIVVKDPGVPAKPTTERGARDAYWKALRQHANGSGTIEQVESAYRELLPYRR